jgi:RNA polymerase sigma factor (sigma-70 family)
VETLKIEAELEGAAVDAVWSEGERRRVTRLCSVLTGDPTVADDLAQETLLQAWRIRHRLVDPSGHRPWMDAIARHVCRRWAVRRARLAGHEVSTDRPEHQQGHPAYAGHDQLGDLLEREELADLLDRALRLLPAETREALVARYVDDLGPQEIARRLAVSPEAVSMRLTRGRARMRELLETDLADEPLAQVWVSRHGVAWRTIQVPCATCGCTTSSMRRDERAGVLELRCERCNHDSLSASWPLDNPGLRPHLTAVRRPSAVLGRMAAWGHGWWPSAIAAGRAACTRCGADVPVVPYARPDVEEPRTRRGWHASCETCGEALSSSLLGLALAFPEVRELRTRRPRAHSLPTREVEYAGRLALAVGLVDDASGDRVDVLFDDETARPLRAVTSA